MSIREHLSQRIIQCIHEDESPRHECPGLLEFSFQAIQHLQEDHGIQPWILSVGVDHQRVHPG